MDEFTTTNQPGGPLPGARRRPNRRPFYLLGGLLLLFAGFVWLLTAKSPLGQVRQRLRKADTVAEVHDIWRDFHGSRPAGDTTLTAAVRRQLLALHPSAAEAADIERWLPAPTALNLIIVPDLSNRLNPARYPAQLHDDTVLLHALWRDFVAQARKPTYAPDQLVVELTNEDQLGEGFRAVANGLITDLGAPARPAGLSNRQYLKQLNAAARFEENVARVYGQARAKAEAHTLNGADFVRYVGEKLPRLLRPATLARRYHNVLVVLTDGYLETSPPHGHLYTGSAAELRLVGERHRQGLDWGTATAPPVTHRAIPPPDVNLADLDVLVLQVEERPAGRGHDYEVLRHYWQQWFAAMHARSFEFRRREESTDLTKKALSEYLRGGPKENPW